MNAVMLLQIHGTMKQGQTGNPVFRILDQLNH